MKTASRFVMLLLTFFIAAPVFAQQVLPMDTAIRYGKLPNGLSYFIRHNDHNGEYVCIKLLQNSGSALEENDEHGMAHFIEHLSLDGTRNFPGMMIREYLDSKGLSFGTDYNAATSAEATTYHINNIPVYDSLMVDSCMMWMRDISCYLSLDDAMIEKERNIIEREYHDSSLPHNIAIFNMVKKSFPNGEPYGNRIIGSLDVIKHFNPEDLRAFYRKWYRPDLQAIVIVGPVDVDMIEQRIKELWTEVSAPQSPSPRKEIEVAMQQGIIATVDIAEGMPYNSILLNYKVYDMPWDDKGTIDDYKLVIEMLMLNRVLQSRLTNLVNQNPSILTHTSASRDEFYSSRWIDSYAITAMPHSNKWREALTLLTKEIKSLRECGVGEIEFRQTKDVIRKLLDKAKSETYNYVASDYISSIEAHFFDKETLADDFQFYTTIAEMLDEFTINDLNRHIIASLDNENVVVSLIGEPHLSPIPTEEQLAQLYIDTYDNAVAIPYDEPVIELKPATNLLDTAFITKEDYDTCHISFHNSKCITLSNGAQVVLCTSTVERGKIRFAAFRRGGALEVDTTLLDNYIYLDEIINCGGLGQNSREEIDRFYYSEDYTLSLAHSFYFDGIIGECSHNCVESMMQHVQLMFDKPIKNHERFLQWEVNQQEALRVASQNPEVIFSAMGYEVLYDNNNPFIRAQYNYTPTYDYDRSCEIYEQKFSNAAQFTFVLVGDMSEEQLQEIAMRYIGVIPGDSTSTTATTTFNQTVFPSPGVKVLERDLATYKSENSRVTYAILSDPLEYHPDYEVSTSILRYILEAYLSTELRENRGLIYTPYIDLSISRPPYEWIQMKMTLDVVPGKESLCIDLLNAYIAQIADGNISTQQFETLKTAIYNDYDYSSHTASHPFDTAIEWARFRTTHTDHMAARAANIEIDDIIEVARLLNNSPHRKTIIIHPTESSQQP